MKNLEIKKLNKSVLEKATLICKGSGFMKTYDLNNGNILKLLKEKDERDFLHFAYFDEFKDCLEGKLKLVKYIYSDSIVLPNAIYMKNDDIVGYSVPKINMKSIDQVLEEENYDIEFMTKVFDILSYEVREANKEDILFPDLGNISNVFMDKKNFKIKFIDYDGLQIGNYESFSVSSLMNKGTDLIFGNKKYVDRRTTLFTTDFDKATLLTLYLYFITGKNIVDLPNTIYEVRNNIPKINDEKLKRVLEELKLLNTPIEDDIERMFDITRSNNYPNTSIKKMSKIYKK